MTSGRFSEKAVVRVSRKMGAVTLTTKVVLYVTGKMRVPVNRDSRGYTLRVEKSNIHERRGLGSPDGSGSEVDHDPFELRSRSARRPLNMGESDDSDPEK